MPFTALLLATALSASPAAPVFSPFKTYPNAYELRVDANARLLDNPKVPMVFMSIQLILARPMRYNDSPIMVKSYQNKIAVDCKRDRIFVLSSKVFDAKDELMHTSNEPQVLVNPHTVLSPTADIIDLVCPTVLERYKDEKEPAPVTGPGALQV